MRRFLYALSALALTISIPAWAWIHGNNIVGFTYASCRVTATQSVDGCQNAPPIAFNGHTLPYIYRGSSNLNSYATSYLITGKGWTNTSLQSNPPNYHLPDHNVPSVDYPTGVNWAQLQTWAAANSVTMPSLSSSVKLDNPLIPNSNGWANHGLPAACAKATLPYVSGVSSAGSPLYKVNCTSAVDLEGWDFGDTYQSGGIPVTMGSASGACTFANNNMNDSANIWAIGSHANMFYSGGTCPGGMTISNNYFDFKADTTWVGSFTYGVQFNNLLGNVTFKYNHWGNAPYRPVGFGPSCSVNAAITADYNDQNVAWQPTTLDAAHGDSGVNFECTTSPAAVSVTLDDEYNFQLNNKGSSSGTGAYVPANVGNTPGLET